MRAYLIQRGNKEDRDWKTGFDSVVHLQYMGSSEFEWGAIPEALERLRSKIDGYVHFDYKFRKSEDKVVTVFCKEEDRQAVEINLEGLADNEYTLQEYSDLNNFVYPDDICKCSADFWWDIDNDWMCWIKDDEFKSKFDKNIGKAPEKKVKKVKTESFITSIFNGFVMNKPKKDNEH